MRRVLPDPAGPVSPDELAAGSRRRVGGRPWVAVCMIASLDGATALDGRSGPLSSANDAALFGALRRAADVILVGAGTVRSEHYRPPRKPGQRIGVVTATGDVDAASDLFTSGAGFLVMPEDGPRRPAGPAGPIDTVRAGAGQVDVALALTRLDTVVETPTFVQAEGGPRFNASLLAAGCLDELNLTLSPRLAGGAAPRVTAGAPAVTTGLELVQLAVDEDGFLYGRWRVP